jgi:hypothetical protein
LITFVKHCIAKHADCCNSLQDRLKQVASKVDGPNREQAFWYDTSNVLEDHLHSADNVVQGHDNLFPHSEAQGSCLLDHIGRSGGDGSILNCVTVKGLLHNVFHILVE